jgi:hypothetical protein
MILAKKLAAERAPSIQQLSIAGDLFAGDPQRMTGLLNPPSCGFQQLVRSVARIAPTACLSIFGNLSDKSVCIGELLPEYRVQKFYDKGLRCFIVVVKDDFAVTSFDLPITHWKLPPTENRKKPEGV